MITPAIACNLLQDRYRDGSF